MELAEKVQVRRRQPADDAFIAKLGAQAFGEYDPKAWATTLHMAQSDHTLIATRGGDPIGLIVVRHNPASFGHIEAIAVVEHERGRGIGRLLMASAEREVANQRGIGLRLFTAAANVAALELFLKRGFRIERRLPRFYVGMYDACELVKRF